MITFLKFTNQSGATVKYTPISLTFSGDDFFVISNTFIKGRTENKSERAFLLIQIQGIGGKGHTSKSHEGHQSSNLGTLSRLIYSSNFNIKKVR